MLWRMTAFLRLRGSRWQCVSRGSWASLGFVGAVCIVDMTKLGGEYNSGEGEGVESEAV